MKNYIVRNCPAHFNNVQMLEFSEGDCNSDKVKKAYCKDVTDCVMKRIVENIKTCLQDNTCNNCDGVGYYDGCQDIKCADYQARQCLELLEIEECE